MSLKDTLTSASDALSAKKISFALIGGFALAAHGIVRATQDIDLLVDGTKKDSARVALAAAGFAVSHSTEEVMHLTGPGQLDILFANRTPTQDMLKRATKINDFPVPVVVPEDLIALKIQAYCNDRSREFQDKADIQSLLQSCKNLNFDLIKKHADLFGEWPSIEAIRVKI